MRTDAGNLCGTAVDPLISEAETAGPDLAVRHRNDVSGIVRTRSGRFASMERFICVFLRPLVPVRDGIRYGAGTGVQRWTPPGV